MEVIILFIERVKPLGLMLNQKGIEIKKIISLIIVILSLSAGIFFYFEYIFGPIDHFSPKEIEVNIPTGSNLSEIASILEEMGLIRKSFYFVIVSKLKGVGNQLKAGYYQFSTDMTVNQIVNRIVTGEVATIKLTIPEGLTIKEMAPLIQVKVGISEEEFLAAARKYRLDFAPEIDVDFQVEGFLFPDTYNLPLKITAEGLIEVMVNRFKKVVGIDPVNVNGRELNIWELATIASLIEEEAKLDGDRPLISGVIYNRLEKRMNLQLCASVLYVLEEKKDRLSLSDTKINSPYNTYKYSGLPIGPISNPSLKSLQAAIDPEINQYFFYFALPDGTTFYSRTYEEHLKAVEKYLD